MVAVALVPVINWAFWKAPASILVRFKVTGLFTISVCPLKTSSAMETFPLS
ncbi:hypothetical protein Barb7_01428 [Bacteroidales bacterium Barb7]|nr:hypothetical protein Barb7_01428 [Bacteroidales bacterium Barb7]